MKEEFSVQLNGSAAVLTFAHHPTGMTGWFGHASGGASGCQITKTPGSGEWSFQAADVGNGTEGSGSPVATAGV